MKMKFHNEEDGGEKAKKKAKKLNQQFQTENFDIEDRCEVTRTGGTSMKIEIKKKVKYNAGN